MPSRTFIFIFTDSARARPPHVSLYYPFPVHPMSAGVHWCVSHVISFYLTYLRAHTHAVALRAVPKTLITCMLTYI
jgi:hypothetical protein